MGRWGDGELRELREMGRWGAEGDGEMGDKKLNTYHLTPIGDKLKGCAFCQLPYMVFGG
ncbi:MAG: hypothetical protein F6J86_36000 [Symploca sp. SIO1B1]|nr:hypothetical protein [Symploca sp. SIO1B1]